MRVHIYCDERYPYYGLERDNLGLRYGYVVQAKTVKRWERVIAEFDKVQEEMARVSERPMREFKSRGRTA